MENLSFQAPAFTGLGVLGGQVGLARAGHVEPRVGERLDHAGAILDQTHRYLIEDPRMQLVAALARSSAFSVAVQRKTKASVSGSFARAFPAPVGFEGEACRPSQGPVSEAPAYDMGRLAVCSDRMAFLSHGRGNILRKTRCTLHFTRCKGRDAGCRRRGACAILRMTDDIPQKTQLRLPFRAVHRSRCPCRKPEAEVMLMR
jgi:hypothetical protein